MSHWPTRRDVLAATASVATLLLSGCTSADPAARTQQDPATSESPSATSPPSSVTTTSDVLSGTWATPPITMARLRHVAVDAGFARTDVADLLAGFGDTRHVVYTMELHEGFWVTFETRDKEAARDSWAGPYEVLDDSTVRAGQPPCGPITYSYRLDGKELRLDMTDDQCFEGRDEVAVGELIAQTTIYESAPFHRID